MISKFISIKGKFSHVNIPQYVVGMEQQTAEDQIALNFFSIDTMMLLLGLSRLKFVDTSNGTY